VSATARECKKPSEPTSIAFETGTMRASAQGGEAATHPLLGDELRASRQLKRSQPRPSSSPRSGVAIHPVAGFAKLLACAGDEPKIGFKVHPAHGIGIAPTLVVAAQQQSLRIS